MSPKRPPLGVRLTATLRRSVLRVARCGGHGFAGTILNRGGGSIKRSHSTHEAAATWITQMQNASRTGVDATQTLAEYVTFIGDRWTRGIDPTSTYDPYSAGLRRRVLPTLGHLPVAMITAGLVDRAIDQWETEFGRSTIKNTVSALVLVLNEAVRDGIISRNPATDRARRRTVGRSSAT